MPILRGDYPVEWAAIVLFLFVISIIRRQRYAMWVLLLGVGAFIVPFVQLYFGDYSLAGPFPYDIVWGLSLPIIVVGAFGLCVRFLRRAAN